MTVLPTSARSFVVRAPTGQVARSIDQLVLDTGWLDAAEADLGHTGHRRFRVRAARRPAAVVFVDLCGFVEFCAAHDDREILAMLTENTVAAGAIARSHGGRLVKRSGDGFLLYFADPQAALWASLELVGALSRPLTARAGAHQGQPLVTPDDLVGRDVNLAARLVDLADPGGVLVTDTLARSAGTAPEVEMGPAFDVPVRGLATPVRVRRMRATPAGTGSLPRRCVGGNTP